ncbi:unnamed protein product [Caenorhabditis brenneri]
MAAWSCLPPEIKLHVIRKLDFMSRKSLRCVSYSDRELVDSKIFKLPRVRFGYKNGRCLIVIYTGIEKFLRWEMEMGGDGFIHYRRSENNFDPEFLVKITALDILPGFADAFMLSAVLSILTKLVAHKSIQIKTMEWELSSDGLSEDEIEMAGMIINDSVETNTFRVEEHVFLERNHATFNSIVMGSMNRDLGLKSFRRLGIIIDGEHLVPEAAHESVKKMDDGVTRYRTTLLMKDTFPTQVALMHKSFEILKMHYEKDCPSRATYRSVYNKYENEQVKRKVENDGLVTYITETKCGCTVQRTYAIHEKDYMEEVDIKKCVLGDLCKRCADPFDYWYTQNLPRRFHYEPFWNGIIEQSPIINRGDDLIMVLLKVKLEKYEKEKARIQKIVDLKRGKVGGAKEEQCSWGFDKKKHLKLMEAKRKQEKDLMEKIEKLEQLGYSLKINENTVSVECKKTGVVREYIVTKENTLIQVPTVTEGIDEPAATMEDTVTQEATVAEELKEPEVTEEDTTTQLPIVKEPLMNQESSVTQDTTVEPPSLLRYLLVLIVIPIALAIIFAFF